MAEKKDEIIGFFGRGLNPSGVMGPANIALLAFWVRSVLPLITMRAG